MRLNMITSVMLTKMVKLKHRHSEVFSVHMGRDVVRWLAS